MKNNLAFFVLTTLLTLMLTTFTESADQTDISKPKTREVKPNQEDPHWSYEGKTGPTNWGTLSQKFSACTEGKNQSPVDISGLTKSNLSEVKTDFKPAQLKIIHTTHLADATNNGHTIQVNYTEGDALTIGDEQFQLAQYHFHSPSEHTVMGKHFPMEMHLVHKSAQGKLAVVGVFIDKGKHNAAFDPIWSNLPKSKGIENHFENVTVDVNSLLPQSTITYRYDGSLTTPPCSEGVKWIIMTSPIQLSADQIGAFQSIIKGNNRPVQPLNGRTIQTDSLPESETK